MTKDEENIKAEIILKREGLKEELDKLMVPIVTRLLGKILLQGGEVITEQEYIKRIIRAKEIMEYALKKAKKSVLMDEFELVQDD